MRCAVQRAVFLHQLLFLVLLLLATQHGAGCIQPFLCTYKAPVRLPACLHAHTTQPTQTERTSFPIKVVDVGFFRRFCIGSILVYILFSGDSFFLLLLLLLLLHFILRLVRSSPQRLLHCIHNTATLERTWSVLLLMVFPIS